MGLWGGYHAYIYMCLYIYIHICHADIGMPRPRGPRTQWHSRVHPSSERPTGAANMHELEAFRQQHEMQDCAHGWRFGSTARTPLLRHASSTARYWSPSLQPLPRSAARAAPGSGHRACAAFSCTASPLRGPTCAARSSPARPEKASARLPVGSAEAQAEGGSQRPRAAAPPRCVGSALQSTCGAALSSLC